MIIIKNNREKYIVLLEAILIIATFYNSVGLGVYTVLFCLVVNVELNQFEEYIDMLTKEEEKSPFDEVKNPIQITGTCKNFYFYKDFTVENFDDKMFRITLPNGNVLDNVYPTQVAAHKIIDEIDPYAERPKYKKSRITNVRFVK